MAPRRRRHLSEDLVLVAFAFFRAAHVCNFLTDEPALGSPPAPFSLAQRRAAQELMNCQESCADNACCLQSQEAFPLGATKRPADFHLAQRAVRLKWVCRPPGRELGDGDADAAEEAEPGWDYYNEEGGRECDGAGSAMLESFELVPLAAAPSPPLALQYDDADGNSLLSPTLFIEAASLLARLAGDAICQPGFVLSATVPLASATHVATA
jgi:hypothetical protein